jgi:RNA polymerase sigma-70 factor (ECF subfamily)
MNFPGGQRAVQKLVDEHYLPLYRYAYRLTGSVADAEDLTQEAYCLAQQKFHQLRDQGKARSWLFSILRNAYLHRIRDSKYEQVVSLEWIGDVAEQVSEQLPDIEPEQLQKALQELPEAYRTPIILYYFEDFSYRDIAEQMELPIGTVMSRLARAKAHLRARLFVPATGATVDAMRRANDGL